MATILPDYLQPLAQAPRFVILGLILLGIWLALRRAGFDRRARIATWLGVAAPLLLWYMLVRQLAIEGVFVAGRYPVPLIPIAIAVPVLAALALLTRFARVVAMIDAAPPSWLVGFQAYRVLGGVFLVLWAQGRLPGTFALPAGTGDVLVGVLALPVAFYLASGRRGGRAAAYAWNVLGIVDLLLAIGAGFLTTRAQLQQIGLQERGTMIGAYPLVMIPVFAVPLSLILHGLSIWQLRRGGRAAVAAARAV